jgi:hypothetical protein
VSRTRRSLLGLVLVTLALAAPAGTQASAGAAPIPVTATQHAAIVRLNGYVTQLVGFTRTISTGIGVKTARIRALRSSIATWRRGNETRFGGRLVPIAQLAAASAAVLGGIDDAETRGGQAATTRYGSAVVAFDRAVLRYSALRFVQRSR